MIFMCNKQLVVKTNKLNQAYQELSLVELRLIQLANVLARESKTGAGFSPENPISISAKLFAKTFHASSTKNVYRDLKIAETLLFERRFRYYDKENNLVKSRWITQVTYRNETATIDLVFTEAVRNEITRIDGATNCFTRYYLEQTSKFKKHYSIRLYELLIQWKNASQIPSMEINELRAQLGLDGGRYESIGDFNRYVLNPSLAEINKLSDIDVSFSKIANGRKITALQFKIKNKTTKDVQKALTSSQINYFSALLAQDADVCKMAHIGEEIEEFTKRIADLLATPQGLSYFEKALQRVLPK